jgi:hypothetical protein
MQRKASGRVLALDVVQQLPAFVFATRTPGARNPAAVYGV